MNSFALFFAWLASGMSFSKMADIMLTKVTYMERERLSSPNSGIVVFKFEANETQPHVEENAGIEELSLDKLWELWKEHMEAQGYQVEECKPYKANAAVRVSRYSTRGKVMNDRAADELQVYHNRGEAFCCLKVFFGKYVGCGFRGKAIKLTSEYCTTLYSGESDEKPAHFEMKTIYIKITKA